MRTEADLSGVPGYAKNGGGYVYVIAFSNEMVKVGKTRNARPRMGDHRREARLFGQMMTECWVSPAHDGWEENERALMDLARELGGTPLSPEYFTGVNFGALAAKARELPFLPPPGSVTAEGSPRRLDRVPAWFKERVAVDAGCNIPYGGQDVAEIVARLTDEVLRDKGLTRLLVDRYVRKSLKAALVREMGGSPKPEVSAPELPEPEPPLGGAQPVREHLALLKGDLTVNDVLEQLANAA